MVSALEYTTDSKSITVSATSGGANGNVLYTCPNNHDATIDYLGVTNGSNSSQKITIQFYHADDTTYKYLTNQHAIAGHDTYHVLNADRFHLHSGDKIICSKDGGTFDVSLSARQFYNPNR